MVDAYAVLSESDDSETLNKEDELEVERKSITLWRSPLKTLYYFGWQMFDELNKAFQFAKLHKITIGVTFTVVLAIAIILNVPGPHQEHVGWLNKEIVWSVWWIGLGILSTVGLGTGLHTFILYLGPHIAKVTMAAWECRSVEFPEPPYPDVVICPPKGTSLMHIDMWVILSKVRWESFMWGVGTAIGELPPYFMARAARLTGNELDDSSFTDLQKVEDTSTLKCTDRFKLWLQNFVQSAGFFGILLCASVPNPLFDLAGITCGYMLIPFLTFFPAVLLGKSVFKVHLQMLCVVILFTADNVKMCEENIAKIPLIGSALHGPFTEYMEQQRITLHGSSADHIKHSPTVISVVFNVFVALMLLFFLVSIIHGLAHQKFRSINQHRLPVKEKKSEVSHLLKDKLTKE
ncbi:hypothetical protein ACHWQZ_G006474 [Mnemiopsis leidyi]